MHWASVRDRRELDVICVVLCGDLIYFLKVKEVSLILPAMLVPAVDTATPMADTTSTTKTTMPKVRRVLPELSASPRSILAMALLAFCLKSSMATAVLM